MKTRGWFSKLLTASLAILMLAGMSPADASAVSREAQETETGSNLFLGKTATLQDDGTYTIQMEAFSTGESTTVMTQTPTDIVLVLDVSGSMDEDFTYVSGQEWTSVTDTVASTPNDAYHHCPDGSYSPITWTEKGTAGMGRYRYVCDNCHASRKWDTPFASKIPGEGDNDSWNLWRYTDITKTEKKMTALKDAVNSFLTGVADRNTNIGEADQQHRAAIVKFASQDTLNTIGNDTYYSGEESYGYYNYTQTIAGMTTVTSDSLNSLTGAVNALNPGGATAADKGMEMAQSILNNTDSSRNKVVVFFTDGDPTYSNSFEAGVANSAVETAKALKESNATIYTIGVFSGADPSDTTGQSNAYMNGVSSNYPSASSYTSLGSGGNNGYYKTIETSGSLADIFEEIQESINTTTVTLDQTAELRDILNDGFVLTDSSEVSVQIEEYSGRDRDGNRVFDNNPQSFDAEISKDNNTIKVSGFDFSKEYLIDGNQLDENDFTAAQQGKRLLVTITGVEATDEAVTDSLISTNSAASGIYENADAGTPFALFQQPQTQLSSKAYVVDYAKEISTADLPNSVISLNADGMKMFTSEVTTLTLTYGTATSGGYAPATMNWDGYDSYYSFGQWKTTPEGVTTGDNTWTKVSVIPANNVYYEDDFITNKETGTVGIEYTGIWSVDGTSSNNTETPDTDVHGGWQNKDLANDATYSDGSAHCADAKNGVATATFTFTGSGVDVYSRTNIDTGYVVAQLYKGENTTAADLTKSLVVDNLAESGDYYQIPTVSFTGLDHGTYTVKLTVASTSDNRSTYYIDGIRVYNPLSSEQEADSTVSDAYGDEIGAVFTEVRGILIDSASVDAEGNEQLSGSVFLDKTGGTYDVGEYINYGPKHEVYLAKDQAILITVGAVGKISIGMKAPEGRAEAQITNGNDATSSLVIETASDLYYEVTPNDDGQIMIANKGDDLLAVTKLKMSGTGELAEFSLQNVLTYANEFSSLRSVEYVQQPSDDQPEIDTPSETEDGDVVIDNPTDTPDVDDTPDSGKPIVNWINDLINGFKNLFSRL